MLKVGDCKALARQNLSGRYGTVIGAQVIASVIQFIVLMLTAASLGVAMVFGNVFHNFAFSNLKLMAMGALSFTAFLFIFVILSVFLYYGQIKLMLNLLRGRKYGIGNIFYAFKKGSHPWRIMLIQIIKTCIVIGLGIISQGLRLTFESGITNNSTTFLAGVATIRIVFIIISVVVEIETYFCMIAAVDKPETGVWECFKHSARLMRRRQLKGLWLIYFSFLLWNLLTAIFPIAGLWVMPYMLCTQIIFYMDADGTLWQLPGSEIGEKVRRQAAAEAEAAAAAGADGDETKAQSYESTAASDTAGAEEHKTQAEESQPTFYADAEETKSQPDETPAAADDDAVESAQPENTDSNNQDTATDKEGEQL